MVSITTFRKIALSFADTTEQPHFEKTAFRNGKKIFATLDAENKMACVKLKEVDQSVFSNYDPSVVFPVPNKWGKQGWTNIRLSKIGKSMLTDLLETAYQHSGRL